MSVTNSNKNTKLDAINGISICKSQEHQLAIYDTKGAFQKHL